MGGVQRGDRVDGQLPVHRIDRPGNDPVLLSGHAADRVPVDGRRRVATDGRCRDHVEPGRVRQADGHRNHPVGGVDHLNLADLAAGRREQAGQQPVGNLCLHLIDPIDQEGLRVGAQRATQQSGSSQRADHQRARKNQGGTDRGAGSDRRTPLSAHARPSGSRRRAPSRSPRSPASCAAPRRAPRPRCRHHRRRSPRRVRESPTWARPRPRGA